MSVRVGIVGGGMAGLAAAAFLKHEKELGADVCYTVLEKGERPGRKLLMTGKGRCNITNRKAASKLKEGYHEAGNYIYKALKAFDPDSAVSFIEEILGVPLKEEENNRMFPVTDKAKTILDAFEKYIGPENIVTEFNCEDVDIDDDGVVLTAEDGRRAIVDVVILACGGKSFPATGSDGSGYELARSFGHTITPLVPALVGVDVASEDRLFTAAVSGVSVSAGANLYYDSRKQAATAGDVLFTGRGVSGPAIMELSRDIPRDIGQRDGWIEIDFAPYLTDEDFDEEFTKLIDSKPDTKLTTLASNYVPRSVAENLGVRAGVTELYASGTVREKRKAYEKEIKHLTLHIENAPDYKDAYVTRGGVSLKEVDRETMRSKLSDRMYIIGEMLDIDGVSGGYNLQACMSEAFIAVKNILI